MTRKSPLRWCLLVHALPTRPLYLRARVRRQLSDAGAAPLKKAVYVLPHSPEAMERMQAIAEGIRSAGASSFVCEATFPDAESERNVVRAYNDERHAQYRDWIRAASAPPVSAGSTRSKRGANPRDRERWSRLKARLKSLRGLDRFGAAGQSEAAAVLARLERAARSAPRGGGAERLVGRTWVTRKGLHVDRLACAWVVRRFIDPAARFRFVSSPETPLHENEIGFDMPGAAITHEIERCSVESLLVRARLRDPAVRRIAEIVHDIDLKDERFRHPETAGFERLLVGTIASLPSDTERLERGLALFDALQVSLGSGGLAGPGAAIPPRVRIPASLRRRRPS